MSRGQYGKSGVYNLVPITLGNEESAALAVDVNGRLIISPVLGEGFVADDAALAATPDILPIGGEYRAAATTYTDGDATILQTDVNGNLKVSLGTKIAGEDIANDVMKTEQRFSHSNVTADAAVKSGAGFLHSITILPTDVAATAGTIVLYDNTAESGTVIGTIYIPAAYVVPVTVTFDVSFATGLYLGFTTTNDVNVTVSYR